ncbi:MAG: DUF4097 family beta strand repeat-containing protein [Candidatus Cloacimonetes bacterium]|nr:DUF4097 domain-containing protein [Candidatus Cloacimonadota bacterium]MDY0298468.1 DUF4097 family beta strand repeat-containing protein [Candidatus Cloacimonadaceae bacterium]MCK9332237.1 DUF4097 domain-containing protein [Candidatus Cloacimonadota bacterium]MDD2210123.1 DUF4097 family beta strand repeat-containing protein [Candidatus Cloacimonadota bacterium]MDD3282975.1 DUF4097 family beta strand repeat-containing protein [Candidatus Cloacimonadota bacterium]
MTQILLKMRIAFCLSIILFVSSCDLDIMDKLKPKAIVNGITLNHKGEMSISMVYSSDILSLELKSSSVLLKGRASKKINIRIEYWEFEPGDAIIRLEDSSLVTSSISGKPVLISSVSGLYPDDIDYDVSVTNGDIEIVSMRSNSIKAFSGNGTISLNDSNVFNLSAKSETGDLEAYNSAIHTAVMETGTGNIILNNTKIKKRNINNGTGKLKEY